MKNISCPNKECPLANAGGIIRYGFYQTSSPRNWAMRKNFGPLGCWRSMPASIVLPPAIKAWENCRGERCRRSCVPIKSSLTRSATTWNDAIRSLMSK